MRKPERPLPKLLPESDHWDEESDVLVVGLGAAGACAALEAARAGAAETFVDRRQAERLLDELDDLRMRVDRLGARVAAEEQRRNAP